jgi:hypothetical protein
MGKTLPIFFLILFALLGSIHAKDTSIQVVKDTSIKPVLLADLSPKNLLDSLAKPQNMRLYFFRSEGITNTIESTESIETTRDLPLLKAIQLRNKPRETWKFWTLLFNLLFLALIRLIHIKRFDEIVQSAFDLQADFSQYADKAGTYVASHTGLFINFIVAVSFFISNLLALNHELESDNYAGVFLQLSFGLFLLYLGKIMLNLFIGYLFKVKQISSVVIFNALVLNNVLGVALVFINLFFVFVSDPQIANIIASISIITILLSVIYRQIKNIIMISQFSKFQFIYIFLYLCALEILPWLVIFKVFLNSW